MAELKVINNPKNRTILIKENYEFSAMVLRTILSEKGHNSKTIRNLEGFEGIKLSENSILFYDLDLNSLEDNNLLQKIRKKYPQLEIVIINYVGQKIDKLFLNNQYNINKIIQRPFSRREIFASMDN